MHNYIRADYLRVIKRVHRLIQIGLYFLIVTGIVIYHFIKGGNSWNSIGLMEAINTGTALLSVFIGLITLMAVFAEDFKAKTMQVAIGRGISRPKVIASKLITAALISLTDILAFSILTGIFSIVTGAPLNAMQAATLAIKYLCIWLDCVGYMSIVLPILFLSQNMVGGLLLYLFFSSSAVYNILRLATIYGPEWFQKLHLENITLDSCLAILNTHLLLGRLNMGAVLGIVIYLALGYLLTVQVFRKQELDF